MAKSFAIRKKWIQDFSKTPLVDLRGKRYNAKIAYQLFYGKTDDDYPADYPCNFKEFYNTNYSYDRSDAIDEALLFLHFVGIRLSRQALNTHLGYFPDDFHRFLKKVFFIIRTLAHQKEDFDYLDPFRNNQNDIMYLIGIETGKTQLSLFEDYELPQLYGRNATIPEGYLDDLTVKDYFEKIEYTNNSYFLTGKAGTGKSTFIQYFTQTTKKKTLRMAFTGIAAMNVGGVTIHSFFRFPLKPLIPGDEDIKSFDEGSQIRRIIEETDTFVIDEVSMLRADLVEGIDHSLRLNGGNPSLPFGGKQMLFIGDIYQLPPITRDSDAENVLFNEIFQSPYFFDSSAYQQLNPEFLELTKSYRQKDDQSFVELLDRIRTCDVTDDDIHRLNDRYDPWYTPSANQFGITLTTTNAIADRENERRLVQLEGQKYIFEAETKGDFDDEKTPAPLRLELKRYAQVMFIRNDPERRWVNGTLGKVEFIAQDVIEVKLADGNTHQVTRETWEHRGYKYDKEKHKVTSEIKGTFVQYPLRLAWAITIHKSQGLTFDSVVIDLGPGAFVNGQLYTALSRCRSLEGIFLKKRVRIEDVIIDDRLVQFYKNLGSRTRNS